MWNEYKPLAVYLTSVSNFHYQNPQDFILNVADYAVISYSVPPEATLGTGQRMSSLARVLRSCNTLVHVMLNPP